ncbi:MAG TPA: hypothetical protein DHV28_03260 [Ignavibacteriales bacterium]|nr:hypothetical protein [Ignavibacteriales bacterium]
MKNQIISADFIISIILFALLLNNPLLSQNPKQSIINVGNITSWVSEEGFHDWIAGEKHWNGEYPKGKNVGVIFSEGLCWGGLVYDGQSQKVRVNGNTYGTGCAPNTRLFRVKYDFQNGNLRSDAASFFNKDINLVTFEDVEVIKQQYQKDWNEWPGNLGAPYLDKNNNGNYDPEVDVPGVPGALQTLWINYNDNISESNYGSIPIGLEIQETYWAYAINTDLEDVIFRKATLIYKGTSASLPISIIDSMYICLWSDTDLGYSADDFIGCDTTLNLGYTYNSNNSDQEYEKIGMKPPAVGNSYLQGSAYYTGNLSDSAIINFKWKKGYKYFNDKPLTVAILHRTGDYFSDPGFNYNGTLEFYNMMGGFLPVPRYPTQQLGIEFIGYGTYMLPGDPVTGIGQIDGITDVPGDRRMMLMSGPVNMHIGDTVEVVTALIGGIGKNNRSSISHLKYNAGIAKLFYDYFVESLTKGIVVSPQVENPDTIIYPSNYVLYQNYPNPFNSTTTFRFEQPKDAYVTLTVYDVLGKEIAKVIDGNLLAGKHIITHNFIGLASGVYFYQIKFSNEDGNLVEDKLGKTMKFILMK